MADYSPFRKSGNIDDRRDTSDAAEWARALLASMAPEEPAASGATPLGAAAGADDIARAHGIWLLRQAIEAQLPASFNERFAPAKDSLSEFKSLNEPMRRIPFGIGG